MTAPVATSDALTLPTDETPIREAALLYAQAGFAAVPIWGVEGTACKCGRADCPAAGKHPIGANWQKRASTDIDRTRELFANHFGNIGIVIGSGLVIVDIDYYHGGKDGLATLPEMPETLTSLSGSGQGEHRAFRLAQGQSATEITNRSVAQGVDIKTRAGQIVAAPSRHKSGNQYRWIKIMHPALLPDDLYQRIRKDRVVPIRAPSAPSSEDTILRRATAYMGKIPGAVRGQGGHAAQFSAARHAWGWINEGLSESDGWRLFLDFNARCQPPLNERDAQHKWDDAKNADRLPIHEERERRSRQPPTVPPSGGGPSEPQHEPDWREKLIYEQTKQGDKLAKHHENAVVALRFAPVWAGKISFDEQSYRVLVRDPPWHDTYAPDPKRRGAVMPNGTREWTDADSARLSSWIKRTLYGDIAIATCDVAITLAAEANTCDPARDYFDAQKWDGVSRLDFWGNLCLGCADSPYSRKACAWWILSAVARTYEPGCKADCVLILEGPQGARKSTALKTLIGPEWFSDSPIDIGNKDAFINMQGCVAIELAELDSLIRANDAHGNRAKAFFSSSTDKYRPPYGKRDIKVPRRTIFAGTHNPRVPYLTDATGNRRYLPIVCGVIDLRLIASSRDQVWAEAVARYKAGLDCAECRAAALRCELHRWWPETATEKAMCGLEAETRAMRDPWEDKITDYTDAMASTTIAEVWKALGGELVKLDRKQEMRIAAVLGDLGFVDVGRRRTVLGAIRRLYEKATILG